MLCTALTCRKVRQIFLFTSNFGVPEWSQTSQVQSRGKQHRDELSWETGS